MKRHAVVFLAFVFCVASGQQKVSYVVSFDNAVHHEAKIQVTFSGISDQVLQTRMSRSSPGRYALHEFAKNVYDVTASDGKGNALHITRPNPYQWDIGGHDGTVVVKYTVFGDHADGTYLGIDETHAHMNMPATFMWARGFDSAPITVQFRIPKGSGWKAATQLAPTSDPMTFTAPGLQYFMDCPTELSNFMVREWKVRSNGNEETIRLAVHHQGTEKEADAFAEMAKRIVVEEKAVFGELPSYDYGTYTFIADYLPWVFGDGMEHRNSTIMAGRRPLRGTGAVRNIGTVAHEYFHSWNIERIRPKSLEPFNFEEANMSGELWFGEGFTSYYDNLVAYRAGIQSIDRFARSLGGAVNFVVNMPGRKHFSAVEMSMQAPFVDAATSVDAQNRDNTFISYYTWGEAIAAGLDLTLRTRFPGHTLDGFMKAVWLSNGKTEIPYVVDDLQKMLGVYTGDPGFSKDFFQRYVKGHDVVDYGALLSRAGLLLRKANEGKLGFGRLRLNYRDKNAVIATAAAEGSPLYDAGLEEGDTVVSVGGKKISSAADFDAAVEHQKPGTSVEVVVITRLGTRAVKIAVVEDNRLELVPFETAGKPVTAEIVQFRKDWLDSKAVERLPDLVKTCPRCKRTFPFRSEFCQFDGSALNVVDED